MVTRSSNLAEPQFQSLFRITLDNLALTVLAASQTSDRGDPQGASYHAKGRCLNHLPQGIL